MKKQNRKYTHIIIRVVIVCLLLATSNLFSAIGHANEITEGESQDSFVSVSYTFTKPQVEQVIINDTKYDRVIMQGVSNSGDPGNPSLPVKSAQILIPEGSSVDEIIVDSGEEIFLGNGYCIEPVSDAFPFSLMNNSKKVDLEEMYKTYRATHTSVNESTPWLLMNLSNEVEFNETEDPVTDKKQDDTYSLIGVHDLRGYRIVVLSVHPVQYNASTGELTYYSEITITIKTTLEQSEHQLFRGREEDRYAVEACVDNPNIVSTYSSKKLQCFSDDTNCDMVIITSELLKDGFEPLKQAHDDEGLKTQIYAVEDIYAEYPGVDNQQRIRNFIRDAYINWNIEYVLLGGDSHIIPVRRLFDSDTNIPADIYYSCLDGPFNYDNDSRWGEPKDGQNGKNVDLVAEVYVGRACVDNMEEVSHFVEKTITYMNSCDTYVNKVLMAGEFLGWSWSGKPQWGGSYMDELIKGSKTHGYTTVGIPSDDFGYNINKLYDRSGKWSKSAIINRINNIVHIINHLGHANYQYTMKMYTNDVYSLTNNKLCFIYSQGCMAGGFDRANCIAEHFTVKTTQGAFAGIWNSRYGWGRYDSTDGPSQRYHREFWDAIYGEGITAIGKANQDSKEDNLYRINQIYMRWCYYTINLFGDPSLCIKSPWRGEHNIGITVDGFERPSRHTRFQEPIYLNTTVLNYGQQNETNVTVSFFVNGIEIDSKIIPFFPHFTTQKINFSWMPTDVGIYNITVKSTLSGVDDEFKENNEQWQIVIVGILNENTQLCFSTIQEAVDAASTLDGHTLLVPVGTFYENLIITKNLIIRGVNQEHSYIDGGGATAAFFIRNTSSVEVSGFTIRNATTGVSVLNASNVVLHDACIVDNTDKGIALVASHHGTIRNCRIHGNTFGIHSSNCTTGTVVYENEVIENNHGVFLDATCRDNTFHHNTFNNAENAKDEGNNCWDNGYISTESAHRGGNWWSDYNGGDQWSGPNQDEPYPDAIGDLPYDISNGLNQDQYPLTYPYDPAMPVINLNTGKTYGELQDAINDPQTHDGHSIFAWSHHVYVEELCLYIWKSVTLIGEQKNTTVIDIVKEGYEGLEYSNPERWYFSVLIKDRDVTMIGFTISKEIRFGVLVDYDRTTLYDNYIEQGIMIFSDQNEIIKNTVIGDEIGIKLVRSSGNTIRGNTLISKGILNYAFRFDDWNTHIIEDNEVDGRPIFYMKNTVGGTVPKDRGQVILANCSSSVIENQKNLQGEWQIQIGHSSEIHLRNNTCANTVLVHTKESLVANNMIHWSGLMLHNSKQNIITQNTFRSKYHHSICMVDSHLNIVTNNTVEPISDNAIYFYDASKNLFRNNTIHVKGTGYGFYFGHLDLTNDIDTSNTINGVGNVLVLSNIDTLILLEGLHFVYPELTYATNVGLLSLSKCKNVIIRNCTFAGNAIYGLFLFSCQNIVITNCTYRNNGAGIFHGWSSNSQIDNCTLIDHIYQGINLFDSPDNTILDNIFIKNQDAAIVLNSNPFPFPGFKSTGNIIRGNLIKECSYGIVLNRASYNILTENTLVDNKELGLFLTSTHNAGYPPKNNRMYRNNFIQNAQQALDRGYSYWYNSYPIGGNYWSDFDEPAEGAYDNDSDGFVDSSYSVPIKRKDRYPLIRPYLPDLLIVNVSAEKLSEGPGQISPTNVSNVLLKLTAIVMNNGTKNITKPFRVSFYATPEDIDQENVIKEHCIGSDEITMLATGETASISIVWEPHRPDVRIGWVCADSFDQIFEPDEENNWMVVDKTMLLQYGWIFPEIP